MEKQKAAMFGLDARIALAIFGALSVITGASLYGALKNVERTTAIHEMSEMAKAYEAFYLDTGTHLPLIVANTAIYVVNMVDSSLNIPGWKGPYIPYKKTDFTSPHLATHSKYEYLFYLSAAEDSNFGSYVTDSAVDRKCAGNANPCAIWVAFHKVPEQLAKDIDKKVDGVLGANEGDIRVRLYMVGAEKRYAVFYKVMPYLD